MTTARLDGNVVRVGFVGGARLEITGPRDALYEVAFVDTARDEVVHAGRIRTNQWIQTARQYFTPWRIDVRRAGEDAVVYSHRQECRGRRVYVAFESKALGDTLAWFSAVEAFQRRHRCRVVCSTFMNDLFHPTYPAFEFVEPGTTVHDLYAMYRLGWFYGADGTIDFDRNVQDFRRQPLSASAFDILGLPLDEQRPRLVRPLGPPPLPGPYVCIAVHATAQAKYWNHPAGWAQVVRFLGERGLRVVLVSKEGREYMGNVAPPGAMVLPEGPLAEVIRYLAHARLFIGVGSGLAWLAWAVGCRTCLVSGFSLPYSEMRDCLRVFPGGDVCTGCFNRHRLDPDDWNWCPEQRGTPRMFECTKTIRPEQVIEAIRDHL